MSGNEMAEAVQILRAKYPQERVQMWVTLEVDSREHYTAAVGDCSNAQYQFGVTPAAAVDALIAVAGDRNPDTLRFQKILELRKQLEELEAQGMAQLIQECDEQKVEVV